MLKVPELVAYCFAEAPPELGAHCGAWMNAAPRYRTFVETHRDKIRKKVRNARDGAAFRDLLLELAVAHRLLLHRAISLAYEPFSAEKTRGPDYTATYTTKLMFNVEVRRLRGAVTEDRWVDMLSDKLGQMPPSSVNVLVVAAEPGEPETPFDMAATMVHLRGLAERHEDVIFQRRGLSGARAYLQGLLRLSAIFLWYEWDGSVMKTSLWENAHAKFPLPKEARSIFTTW